jgi:hypothetical protein
MFCNRPKQQESGGKIQLKQLLIVVFLWQLAAILLAVYDHFMIHSVFVTINERILFLPGSYLLFNMTAALVGSLVAEVADYFLL